MSASKVFEFIMSWAAEDTHRGRLARAFQNNMGDDPQLQAQRMGLLSVYLEREAKRGLALV